MPTSNYYIGPQDGWTQVTEPSEFVYISSYPITHPYYIFEGSEAPETDPLPGVGVYCGVFRKGDGGTADNIYVYVPNSLSGSRDGDGRLRIDVFTTSGGEPPTPDGALVYTPTGEFLTYEGDFLVYTGD